MARRSYLVDSNTIIHASKAPKGEIARWLKVNKPFVTDVSLHECLERWKRLDEPGKVEEKIYLESFFIKVKKAGRFLETMRHPAVSERAYQLNRNHNIKIKDALIAAAAEIYGHILVTADRKKDFAPRLEK